jgi:hypothetical protein
LCGIGALLTFYANYVELFYINEKIINQGWPTRPASGAALQEATIGKNHTFNTKIH